MENQRNQKQKISNIMTLLFQNPIRIMKVLRIFTRHAMLSMVKLGPPYKCVFSEREDVNACTTVMISKETTGTMITSLVETSASVKDRHHSQIVRSASQNQCTELTTDEIGTKT